MEILRNKIAYLLFIVFNLILFQSNAQTKVVKAFEDSYNLEYAGKVSQAIDKLKTVYSQDSYEINLRLGWLNYENGLFKESIANYQRAISLMPYSEEAKFGLILPYIAVGQWDNVINLYKKILDNSPNNTIANYRLGLIYYGKENYQEAYKYFKKVVDLYPFGYDGLIIFAQTNYKLGKFREAKVLFNKVLMIYPQDNQALEGLSKIK